MIICTTIDQYKTWLATMRRENQNATLGFVPTMGALHRGHGRLIEAAVEENDFVAVSIFVNPLQFGPQEDFQKYPRTFQQDIALVREHGVSVVFAPEQSHMYPEPMKTTVFVSQLGDYLCGTFRPGHFDGVCTVVMKLFNIICPDRAYFGQKDAQQLAIIKRMTADLSLGVAITPVATVRESDGLALSSRNKYLTAAERTCAPDLFIALKNLQQRFETGITDAAELTASAKAAIEKTGVLSVQYLCIVDPTTLQPQQNANQDDLVAAAVYTASSKTRLIDNIIL